MPNEAELLERAETILRDKVAPHAQEIDGDPEALRAAFQALVDNRLIALRVGPEYGGEGLSERGFRRFQEAVARTSGSLAFLQTQHQSAASLISKTENQELRESYLRRMVGGSGEFVGVGIGFSQLRRPGPPIMRAEAVDGGYRLDGEVPWITGLSFYDEFVIGATLPSGEALFAIVPFRNEPGITLSEPMRLCAMESALTVSGRFDGFFVPVAKVLYTRPIDWIARNDMINITLQGHFALGCAQAGIDVFRKAAERKPLPFLLEAAASLERELARCRQAAEVAHLTGGEETTEERLQIRGWAIDLAVRCAHAGIAASSGAANSLSHPAQRVYREALVFTVSAQTSDVMRATLDRLVARE